MTVDQLLKKWLGKEGGAERANYQMFLTELALALDLPTPEPKGAGIGDYQFEAPVKSQAVLGTKGTGRIDLYKRDHFILEAKQSQLKPGETLPEEPAEAPPEPSRDLFDNVVLGVSEQRSKRAPRYDRLMADARVQAERYALALPDDHKTPPFLIVADIGRGFELYFDWSANGRGYGPFPNERHYRIRIEDLASPARIPGLDRTAAEVLQAVWTAPRSIDPRLKAVEVTRDVAERLSRVAAALEKEQRDLRPGDALVALGIEETSLFLMRLLFCMFAEDVGLLPEKSLTRFLEEAKGKSDTYWSKGLTDLWSIMNDPTPGTSNRYWTQGDAIVRHFNGNLFHSAKVYPLASEFQGELLSAAKRDWRSVEPAIFGTLLEQVLTTADRAKLGAHYTPRAYVERLVEATVMEVLRPEWEATLADARRQADAGEVATAIEAATAFHVKLADLKVLDPACGTGNFLYVAMEQLLRLESEVRQFVIGLGGTLDPAIHPNQFLGLELNPRAAVIAELVLWIGWLRYRLANTPDAIGDPVLPTLSNINFGTHGGLGYDAVLARTEIGEPDRDNPRRPLWPEADFIIGNPPFIGGKDIRDRLGGDVAEALWRANPTVPKSADFVMHWWDRAAKILTAEGTRLRRFGFVTTNSITQVFSRRVIEKWLSPSIDQSPSTVGDGSSKLHLTLAIADHPWTRVTKDAAAVRIAMTVAEAGVGDGKLVRITGERGLDSDEPMLDEAETNGVINADLTIGTNVAGVAPLKANIGLCSRGVQLMGSGFIVTPAKARELGLGSVPGLEKHIRDYRNGRDLLQRPRGVMVIDLFGLTEDEVMDRYPDVYQHLLKEVRDSVDSKTSKPNGRSINARESYKKYWWIFGEPRREMRSALLGLASYIATTETSKHRIFQFVQNDVLADNMIVVMASDGPFDLGVLHSKIHASWTLEAGGWLGFGNDNRYNKSKVFDPFPFPNPTDKQRDEIVRIAERLDQTRRAALDDNPLLTMTGLYNLVEAVRAGTLPPEQEAQAIRARARIVAKLHDDLDQAVADAYGWGEEWRRAPLPPAEIVTRLVALNAERAAEEAEGTIRWLRPDYQVPRFGEPTKAKARKQVGPGSSPG